MREAAPGRAGAVPPQPLRLPDPLLPLPRQLSQPAAHRRRHQSVVLAARAAVPRRRGVLHPPHLRRQRALQGGLPHVPQVPHPRGLHAGVLHRGRAQPHREDPHAEARHAVGDRRRVRRRACGATSTWCRCRSTTAAWSRRRPTSASSAAAEKEPESLRRAAQGARACCSRARDGRTSPSPIRSRSTRRSASARRSSATSTTRRRIEREAALHAEARLPAAARGERGGGRRRDVGLGHGAARLAARACRHRRIRHPRARAGALSCARAACASPRRSSATPRASSARTSRFLESGGLIQRLASEARSVIHVPAEKRLALDFYKNNTIHFFLLPALLLDALCARTARRRRCRTTSSWWLDLFRWEFPLPERESSRRSSIGCAATSRRRARCRRRRRGRRRSIRSSLTRAPDSRQLPRGVLDRRAGRCSRLPDAGLPQKAVIERMQQALPHRPAARRSAQAGRQFVGDARQRAQPLRRARMRRSWRAGKGKERMVVRGARFDALARDGGAHRRRRRSAY